MTMYNDYPFYEIAKAIEEHAAKGCNCYQKFSCEKCGSRQTITEPNKLYTKGKCQECGHVTNILAKGCNYLIEAHGDGAVKHTLDYMLKD